MEVHSIEMHGCCTWKFQGNSFGLVLIVVEITAYETFTA